MTAHRSMCFRYPLFATLYFTQGAILSYFTALNALYLLSFDLTMTQVGLFSSLAMLPFVLKIFLGMLSDRVNLLGYGHRKPYIVLGLVIQAGCLFLAPLINPGTHFWSFALLAATLMTGMALYDTCTDGLALDTTPEEEEGTVQGLMVSGRAVGVVVVSAGLGVLAQRVGWWAAFWSLGVLTLLPLGLALRVQEPDRPPEQTFEWRAFRAFRQPAVATLALLGALYSLVIYSANEILNPFLQDTYGVTYTAAGLYTATWGVGVALGGLSGGRLTDRWGHRRAVLGAMGTSLLATLALALIPNPYVAWPLVLLFGLAFGYYETVYFAMAMGLSDRRIGASMFAILMAVANVGTGLGFAVTGGLVERYGYRWTFVFIALLNVLALPLIPVIFGRREAGEVASV